MGWLFYCWILCGARINWNIISRGGKPWDIILEPEKSYHYWYRKTLGASGGRPPGIEPLPTQPSLHSTTGLPCYLALDCSGRTTGLRGAKGTLKVPDLAFVFAIGLDFLLQGSDFQVVCPGSALHGRSTIVGRKKRPRPFGCRLRGATSRFASNPFGTRTRGATRRPSVPSARATNPGQRGRTSAYNTN